VTAIQRNSSVRQSNRRMDKTSENINWFNNSFDFITIF